MGQGGYLHLTNATPYNWKLTHVHSYQMEAWDKSFPEEIKSGESVTLYIEFCNGFFKTWTDDGGEAQYTIQGLHNPSFTFLGRWFGDTGGQLLVELKDIVEKNPDWFPVPPPPTTAVIGWSHGGTKSWTLAGIGPTGEPANMTRDAPNPLTLQQVRAVNIDAFQRSLREVSDATKRPTVDVKEANRHVASFIRGAEVPTWKARWMGKGKKLLTNLTLKQICIPGTHDSGTYDLVSPVAGSWAATQKLNILEQLEGGIRSLDLRVGYKGGDNESGLILVHDTWRTEVSVKSAMQQVVAFLEKNSSEFLILDFHRFPDLSAGAIDYVALKNIVIDTLRPSWIVPPSDYDLSMGELWNKSGRVVVLWNREDAPTLFGRGVDQVWKNTETPDELEAYIEAQLAKRHIPFWALCAVIPAGGGPFGAGVIPHIGRSLDNWFLAGNKWMLKTNIVSVDFFEESDVVVNCVSESYRRGATASALSD